MGKWIRNMLARLGGEGRSRTPAAAERDEIVAMVYLGDVYPVRVVGERRRAASVPVRVRRETDSVWPFIR